MRTIITNAGLQCGPDYSDQFVFDSQPLIRAVVLDFRIEEVAIETRYPEAFSSADIPKSIRYILESFGELYRARRDRERLKQEFKERSKPSTSETP